MIENLSASLAIARMTFAEVMRNKVMYGLLIFLIVLLITAATLASVTMGRTEMMVLDLGFGGISLLSNLMAIVLTIQSLQQEKESRTLYVLLTRLSARWQYMLGKFLGLATVLGSLTLLMCALLTGVVALIGEPAWPSVFQACYATLLELWLVIAISMLFAQSSSLFLAILLSLCVDVAGRFTNTIVQFGEQSSSALLHWATQTIYYLLPNLEYVNLRGSAGYIKHYSSELMLAISVYSMVEITFILLLCMLIFERRNLS